MALLHDSPPPLVISGRIPFSTKVPGRGLPRYVEIMKSHVFLLLRAKMSHYGWSQLTLRYKEEMVQKSGVIT